MRLLMLVSHQGSGENKNLQGKENGRLRRERKGKLTATWCFAARRLGFRIVAGVTATMATDLAPPDSNEGARVAVGAAPGQDVAIGGLHNGEDVAGTLVCHDEVWFKSSVASAEV